MNQHGPTTLFALTMARAGVKIEPGTAADSNSSATNKGKKVKVKKEPDDNSWSTIASTKAVKKQLLEEGLNALPNVPEQTQLSEVISAVNTLQRRLTAGKAHKDFDTTSFRRNFMPTVGAPRWIAVTDNKNGLAQIVRWHGSDEEKAKAQPIE
jgi:hypothetical protein